MLIFLLLIFLIINSQIVSSSIINTTSLFLESIMPNMIIYFFIIDFITNTKIINRIGKIFHPLCRIIFKSPTPLSTSIIILSPFLGCPSNVKLIESLYKQKKISQRNAAILLSFTPLPSLPFILSIAQKFPNREIFIIIPIISNIIIGILLRFIFQKEDEKTVAGKYSFNDSAKKNLLLLFQIYVILCFCNCLIELLSIYLPINKELLGLLELSIGLINTNNPYLFLIFSSFLGFSIHLQAYSIINKSLPYYSFLLGRLLNIIISIGIFTLLTL